MACVWWQITLCEPLYNVSYLSALEARLLQLRVIQIHVYFTYFTTVTEYATLYTVSQKQHAALFLL